MYSTFAGSREIRGLFQRPRNRQLLVSLPSSPPFPLLPLAPRFLVLGLFFNLFPSQSLPFFCSHCWQGCVPRRRNSGPMPFSSIAPLPPHRRNLSASRYLPPYASGVFWSPLPYSHRSYYAGRRLGQAVRLTHVLGLMSDENTLSGIPLSATRARLPDPPDACLSPPPAPSLLSLCVPAPHLPRHQAGRRRRRWTSWQPDGPKPSRRAAEACQVFEGG